MKVDFVTYCCHKDVDKLQADFNSHVSSHGYNFNKVHLVYQRIEPRAICENEYYIDEKDYPDILTRNGINPDNKQADDYTHGWGHSHYWRHHCVNHLVALEESDADYIVMSDADCHIESQPSSWIANAIDVLKRDSSVLIVSPSDGTKSHKTQTMSQQLFLCDRKRLQEIDFDTPFTGFRDGGPMQEYYFMLEGR